VEIGRAIIAEPILLLLDEPSTGMSPEESNNLANLLVSLGEHGPSLLLIEHNLRVVRAVCQNAIVMNEGQVLAYGEVESVLARDDVAEAYYGTVKSHA
jgi:ABC-type branched-subunit amino acid transport system ATPase component